MKRAAHLSLLFALALLGMRGVAAQSEVDEVITWRSYSDQRSARVHVFESGDRHRSRTVVIEEAAGSTGGPVTDDARFLAETVGRTYGFDPVDAYFVFHLRLETPGGASSNKVLLLRATFRRGSSGDLGSPSWRVISLDTLRDLTDRQW